MKAATAEDCNSGHREARVLGGSSPLGRKINTAHNPPIQQAPSHNHFHTPSFQSNLHINLLDGANSQDHASLLTILVAVILDPLKMVICHFIHVLSSIVQSIKGSIGKN